MINRLTITEIIETYPNVMSEIGITNKPAENETVKICATELKAFRSFPLSLILSINASLSGGVRSKIPSVPNVES